MSRWCIDEIEIVHNAACRFAEGDTGPYLAKPKTNEEMLDHLARPDLKDGHQAKPVLVPCEHCIPTDQEAL